RVSRHAPQRAPPSFPTRRSSDLSSWVPRLAEAASRRPGVGVLVTARAPLGRTFRDLRLAPLSREATGEVLQSQVSGPLPRSATRSEEHTSELQSRENLVCRLLLE